MKRLLSGGLIFLMAVILLASCGGRKPSAPDSEVKTLTGTLTEKKSFMFVIEDNENPYGISFETAPEGYDELNIGDTVTMEYTGELSVVDPFNGEVISLKPAQS